MLTLSSIYTSSLQSLSTVSLCEEVVGTLSLSSHGIPYSQLSLADPGAFPQEVAQCGYQAKHKPLSADRRAPTMCQATSSASSQASAVWISGQHGMAPPFPGCHHQVSYRSSISMPRPRIPLLVRAWKRSKSKFDGVLCYWLFLKCGKSVYPTVTECLLLLVFIEYEWRSDIHRE